MVYGLCRTLLRDPDDADDATQSTFISAYRSLLGGSQVREPAAWLATIARNECAARAHARMREPLPLLDADLGHTQGPEAELERKAVVEELQQAISQLPEKQREAVVLRDLYGLHYTEVGAALGMSVASVESLLFRARRSLRVSLKPLAGGALVVPVAVREGIAQALPGFTTAGAAGGGAASGAVGLGLLAKFSGVPVALKVAVGVMAVTATGSVAVVGAGHAGKDEQPSSAPAHTQAHVARPGSTLSGGPILARAVVGNKAGAAGDGPGDDRAGSDDQRQDDDGGGAAGQAARGRAIDGSEHGESENGGRHGGGSSTGARSGGEHGAGTSGKSGHGDEQSGSADSHDGGSSGDAEAPRSGDDLLEAGASNSGSGDSDPLASGGDSTESGTDSGSGSDGDPGSDGSDSSADSEAPDSGSSGDAAAAPPPPPA